VLLSAGERSQHVDVSGSVEGSGDGEKATKKRKAGEHHGSSCGSKDPGKPSRQRGTRSSARTAASRRGPEGPANPQEKAHEYKIPASAYVLVSKSPVFKRMFALGFREGSGKKQADIELNATGKRVNLLHVQS